MGRKAQSILNPVHIAKNTVDVKEVNPETYEEFGRMINVSDGRFRGSTTAILKRDKSYKNLYFVAIGAKSTYISNAIKQGTSNTQDRIGQQKRTLNISANLNDDFIIDTITVYAWNRSQVKKLYERGA